MNRITLTGNDLDGDAFTFSIVTAPTHGTLTGSGANRTYTPTTNYSGSDSFVFQVTDSQGGDGNGDSVDHRQPAQRSADAGQFVRDVYR